MEDITTQTTKPTVAQMLISYNSAAKILGVAQLEKWRKPEQAETKTRWLLGELKKTHPNATLRDDFTVDVGTAPTAPATSSPKTPRTTKAPKAPVAGRSTIDTRAELVVLAKTNPKRAGSRSHGTFELYDGCATGEDYIAKMIAAGHDRKLAMSSLHWDTQHHFIRIGTEVAAPAAATTAGSVQEGADPAPTTESAAEESTTEAA